MLGILKPLDVVALGALSSLLDPNEKPCLGAAVLSPVALGCAPNENPPFGASVDFAGAPNENPPAFGASLVVVVFAGAPNENPPVFGVSADFAGVPNENPPFDASASVVVFAGAPNENPPVFGVSLVDVVFAGVPNENPPVFGASADFAGVPNENPPFDFSASVVVFSGVVIAKGDFNVLVVSVVGFDAVAPNENPAVFGASAVPVVFAGAPNENPPFDVSGSVVVSAGVPIEKGDLDVVVDSVVVFAGAPNEKGDFSVSVVVFAGVPKENPPGLLDEPSLPLPIAGVLDAADAAGVPNENPCFDVALSALGVFAPNPDPPPKENPDFDASELTSLDDLGAPKKDVDLGALSSDVALSPPLVAADDPKKEGCFGVSLVADDDEEPNKEPGLDEAFSLDDDGVGVAVVADGAAPKGDVDCPNAPKENAGFDGASSFDVVVDSVGFDVPNVGASPLDPVPDEKGDFDLVSIPDVDSLDGLSFDGVPNDNAGLDVSVDDDAFVVNEGAAPKENGLVPLVLSSAFAIYSFIHQYNELPHTATIHPSYSQVLSSEGFSTFSLGEEGPETNTKEDDGESSVASRSVTLEDEASLLPESDNEPNEKLFVVVDVNDDDLAVVVAAPVPKENVLDTVDCSFSADDPGMRLGEETLLESLSPPDTS